MKQRWDNTPATYDARGVRAAASVDPAMNADGMPGSALGLSPNKANLLTSSSTRYRIGAGMSPNSALPSVAPGTILEAVSGQPAAATPSSPPSVPSSSGQAAGPCTLPHFGNLIEWLHEPGKPDRAVRISDIDATKCEPTLNNWTANLVERPGVCYMIGWDSANPGYNTMVIPAPRLPKAMDTIGDGC